MIYPLMLNLVVFGAFFAAISAGGAAVLTGAALWLSGASGKNTAAAPADAAKA